MIENELPKKESITEVLNKYKEANKQNIVPKPTSFNQQEFENAMSKETDPDLMITYEIVKLPSQGLFYSNGLSEINVEYMTSKDEDLLTTPSLIESGSVLDLLLKRKIKTPNVKPESLLPGDRNAIILFLRTSSSGTDYTVNVVDPRNGSSFETKVDLTQLKYKELTELPNEMGYFNVFIPMRKKNVQFRLLTNGEENLIFKKAESIKEAQGSDVSEYNTLKLKAHIVSIDDHTDKSYINRFVDAMPALDAFTIRKKILDVSPDVNMKYTFTTKDGFKFDANLTVGVDFFFPSI